MNEGYHGLLVQLRVCVTFVFLSAIALSPFPGPFVWLWILSGGVRGYFGDDELTKDALFLAIINLVLSRDSLLLQWKELGLSDATTGWRTLVSLGLAAWLALLGISHHLRTTQNKPHSALEEERDGVTNFTLDHPGPLLFPCRTTHARTFPKRHAFEYSYILYGIPVVPAGTTPNKKGIGYGTDQKYGRWWMYVKAEDYLMRGYGELGFYGKLKRTLREQGVQDSEWAYAYLVTAPRFFGYSFNPVSFWYIYDRSHHLRKMILEVNNTFGERRVYLLDGSCPASPAQIPDGTKSKFHDVWTKDFHVSPFNSRKGSYSLKALDPFPLPDHPDARIDNTITLKSSKDHAKIVARVHSTGPPIDANAMGLLSMVKFISGWWWLGLVTFPRILREAVKLYFQLSLYVWFRPEVLPTSVGRIPSSTEITLQRAFQKYLQHLVLNSSEQWNITYHTAIPDHPSEYLKSSSIPRTEIQPHRLEIRVLTPAFYTRFVHYAHTSEAFDRECIFTDERNRTAWISHPELLSLLLPKSHASASKLMARPINRTRFEDMRWMLLRRLRCPPPEPAYPDTPRSSSFDVDDIRTLPFSDLDTFVRGPHSQFGAAMYRRTITKTFLAQRFAFGFVEVVDALDVLLRILLCYAAAMSLIQWDVEPPISGSGKRTWKTDLGIANDSNVDLGRCLGLAIGVCGCHVYGLVKGYR